MWLGFCVAVAVAQASSYNSDSTPSLGTSTCRGSGPRNGKKTKKKKNDFHLPVSVCLKLINALLSAVGSPAGSIRCPDTRWPRGGRLCIRMRELGFGATGLNRAVLPSRDSGDMWALVVTMEGAQGCSLLSWGAAGPHNQE